MNVKRLIRLLEKMPPNMEITFDGPQAYDFDENYNMEIDSGKLIIRDGRHYGRLADAVPFMDYVRVLEADEDFRIRFMSSLQYGHEFTPIYKPKHGMFEVSTRWGKMQASGFNTASVIFRKGFTEAEVINIVYEVITSALFTWGFVRYCNPSIYESLYAVREDDRWKYISHEDAKIMYDLARERMARE